MGMPPPMFMFNWKELAWEGIKEEICELAKDVARSVMYVIREEY